jgi:hypothetical protein
VKIRLYRGPHDGKVLNGYFGNTEFIDGPRKMTREQKYEWRGYQIDNSMYGSPELTWPMIRAEYRRTNCQHPDGSVFYEWTGLSRPYGPQPRSTADRNKDSV